MLFRIFFFIAFLPFFLFASEEEFYSKAETPLWVKSYDFPLEHSIKPSQENIQNLLIDTQNNWEEKTHYKHFVVKPLTQSGIELISQIKINFHPSYSKVRVHNIRIYREGAWSDRLKTSKHKLLQREQELEQNLYNGNLTLVYLLDDIREGDIIEYSYSIVGEHPLFHSHYGDIAYFQRNSVIEKIVHRILAPSDLSFDIKAINIDIQPKIADLSPSLREWSWEVKESPAYLAKTEEPMWYNPPGHVILSQYRSWKNVAEKLSPLYALPSDFAESTAPEMKALIKRWKKDAKNPKEEALFALRFVQDEIRYFGIEEGMGAFQPTDPNATFQRRFGDCKDKTFLLHALLHLLDIPSTPVLVHSYKGKILPQCLPLPTLFNHIVLKIDGFDTPYYVDPTIGLQGGSLETNFFPNYEYGLLLSQETENLSELPKIPEGIPTQIETFITLETEDLACLKRKQVFHGSKADRTRRSFEWHGSSKISEKMISNMQKTYGTVTVDSPLQILDDRKNNTITLMESYHVPTEKASNGNRLQIDPETAYYLYDNINPERGSPYEILYPLWIKERIQVQSPFAKWKTSSRTFKKENASFLYVDSREFNDTTSTFDFELKHLQDHIPKETLREYWSAVNEITQHMIASMRISSPPKPESSYPIWSILGYLTAPFVWLGISRYIRKMKLSERIGKISPKKRNKIMKAISMFKWHHEISLEVDHSLQVTREFYLNPINWSKWDDRLSTSFKEKKVKEGTLIKIRIKNTMSQLPIIVTELTPHCEYKFTTKILFFTQESLCRFHEITPNKTQIVLNMHVKSPFTPLMKKIFLKNAEKSYSKLIQAISEMPEPTTDSKS